MREEKDSHRKTDKCEVERVVKWSGPNERACEGRRREGQTKRQTNRQTDRVCTQTQTLMNVIVPCITTYVTVCRRLYESKQRHGVTEQTMFYATTLT